ncbi:MAG TPA: glycosyltransferase family 4 protein [Anaerolineales bacterium]|nr:glycosyltransferase family 4 protein [Anaerolineales bacterium]
MDVAILHHAANPILGGVENVMRAHSRLLAKAGHRVRIVAGRGSQVDPDVEFVKIPLVDSQAPEVLAVKPALDSGTVPREFDRLTSEVESRLAEGLRGTELVFAHNVCSLNKNLALTAALLRLSEKQASPRLVLWHHDLAWTTPRYRSELHPGYPWDLLRSDWPRAVQVTISEFRRRELADLLRVPTDRIRVVPNGIDVTGFLGIGAEAGEIVQRFALLEAAPLLLLPVRITRRKNIDLALQILQQLKKKHADVMLLVTGPAGPHNPANREYLDNLLALRKSLNLEDRAVFVSAASGRAISDEALGGLYRLADALILTSTEEGFGIPILEAALAGIPCFCPDIAPLRELGGEDIHYFPPGADAALMAEQMSAVFSVSKPYVLRKRVLREHTWSRIYAEHLLPLLKEARQ